MADGYSWNYARGSDRNKLPGPEHLGWWAALALLLSIGLHGVIYVMLERMEIAWSFQHAKELSTETVRVRQVEVSPYEPQTRMEPEDVVPVPEDTSSLLEEIDLLAALPEDQDIDISTEIDQASYALKMSQPEAGGEAPVRQVDPAAGVDIDTVLPDVGSEPKLLPPAAINQVVIDSGATRGVDGSEGLTETINKSGLGDGSGDGIASLDDLLKLPSNVLLSKKTMLPSDLLFEFNSAELRESARLGLMKLALLMDRNPSLYCWIEGHTDMIGGDAFNLKLSMERAKAVKSYLVTSMRMDPKRIIARGLGRAQPLVNTGDAQAQAPNRRVEIRMRKTPPGAVPAGANAEPLETPAAVAEPEPPRAVLIKPRRAQPVEEPRVEAPKANVVTPEGTPRARPVLPESPPRAEPVAE